MNSCLMVAATCMVPGVSTKTPPARASEFANWMVVGGDAGDAPVRDAGDLSAARRQLHRARQGHAIRILRLRVERHSVADPEVEILLSEAHRRDRNGCVKNHSGHRSTGHAGRRSLRRGHGAERPGRGRFTVGVGSGRRRGDRAHSSGDRPVDRQPRGGLSTLGQLHDDSLRERVVRRTLLLVSREGREGNRSAAARSLPTPAVRPALGARSSRIGAGTGHGQNEESGLKNHQPPGSTRSHWIPARSRRLPARPNPGQGMGNHGLSDRRADDPVGRSREEGQSCGES